MGPREGDGLLLSVAFTVLHEDVGIPPTGPRARGGVAPLATVSGAHPPGSTGAPEPGEGSASAGHQQDQPGADGQSWGSAVGSTRPTWATRCRSCPPTAHVSSGFSATSLACVALTPFGFDDAGVQTDAGTNALLRDVLTDMLGGPLATSDAEIA